MTLHSHRYALLGGALVAALLAGSPSEAQPPDYWGAVDTSTQETLRDSVYTVIRNHTRIPYTSTNWQYLEAADADPEAPGNVLDFYRNSSVPMATGTRPYDREHVWPQSRGFPDGGTWSLHARADMHNLFICDRPYNASRSNFYFDYCTIACEERPTELTNGAGGGTGVYPGNSNWRDGVNMRWEIWNGRRGDAARAVMYMAARYNGGVNADGSLEPDLRLTDDLGLINPHPGAASVAYMGLQSVLLEWHELDPPDAKELSRHEVIFNAQRNRNPFIDYPEWADCIFLGDCAVVAPMNPQNIIASADEDSVTISWEPRPESDLLGYNVYRSTVSGSGYTKLTVSPIAGTVYIDEPVDPFDLYYYVVTAVDTGSNESRYSSEVSSLDAIGGGIAIPVGPDTPYVQSFDSIGPAVDATMPDGFRVGKRGTGVANVRNPISWIDAVAATELRAGDAMSGTASNGIYNFGAGPAATATDRAVGFLSAGGGTFSGGVIAQFTNTSGDLLAGLDVSYNVEKYRDGTNAAGFSVYLYHSPDGENWTLAPGFTVGFPGGDAANAGFTPAPGATLPVSGTIDTAIPANGSLFVQWLYSVTSGSTLTSAQALGIDDVSVFGILPVDALAPTIASTIPENNEVGNTLPSITIVFDEPVVNVVAGDVTVAGSPATSVTGSGAGPYVFTGFSQPFDGPATITIGPGTIEDLSGNAFGGDGFVFVMDTIRPEITTISAGITGFINSFPVALDLAFTKALDEVDPSAILVNGVEATSVSGAGVGPYTFSGYTSPSEGAGSVVFDGRRMVDSSGNTAIDNVYHFVLDTTNPATTLLADAALVVGTEATFAYSVVDANTSGTMLLVKAPGDTVFSQAADAIVTSDTIVYTALVSGLHQFVAISDDLAGNVEALDEGNAVEVVINTVPNGPLTLDVASGSNVVVTFPMATGVNVEIAFASVTNAGTVTVQRFLGALNAATVGLDASRLAGQVYSILSGGGLAFTEATVSFDLDEGLFGATLTGVDRVFVVRGGQIGEEFLGSSLIVTSGNVAVSGVDQFSEWYFGDSETGVVDWILMLD